MMRSDIHQKTSSWLALERSGAPSFSAERALAGVFLSLPRPWPSAGFVERVVAEARRRRDVFGNAWVRLSIAAGLVVLAFALALLPSTLLLVREILGVASLLTLATHALLWLCEGVVQGLSVWHGFAELGEATSILAATPAGILVLALTGSLLTLSAYLLRSYVFRTPEVSR